MSEDSFQTLQSTLDTEGPPAAFDKLAEIFRREKKYPQLFEALIMKKRHELGLPLQGTDSFRDIPEALQPEVEQHYVKVCREVGSLFLADGDMIASWPYFRAIDEPSKIAEALDKWQVPESEASDSEANSTDAIVDIALNQGANPRRGYELVLSEYGVCRAITTFEHQFPYTGEVKEQCGTLLIRRLHDDLVASLVADIGRHDKKPPPERDVRELIENRDWLFEDHGYHVDMSHLQSVIRIASSVSDREILDLGLQMTEYGRRLPRNFQSPDLPPFEDFYNDYRIFFQAMVGTGVDGAVRYFTLKADAAEIDEEGKHLPGEVLVHLLYRLGRYQDAMDAYEKYLKDQRSPPTAAPTLFEISECAGNFSKLLKLAKEKDDLLQYTAGLVRTAGSEPAD